MNEFIEALRADEKSDVLIRDKIQPWQPAVLGMPAEASLELLADLARHFVKLGYCADMAKEFGEIFWDGTSTVDYLDILTGPDGTEPRDFAARCLNTILLFRPDDFYANYLLGTILRDQGRYDEAIRNFKAATIFGGFAHHAWWQAGLLLEKVGRDEEAIEAYRHATGNNRNPRGIEISQFGDCLRRNGYIAEAMEIYDRALGYEYSHLKELLHPENWSHDPGQPSGLLAPWAPGLRPNEDPQMIRENDSRVHSLLGRPGDVYQWHARYFAVPSALIRLSPDDLGGQGLWRDGWRGALDKFLETLPVFYRLFGPAIHVVLPGVARRFLRRRIRSASAIEDLLESSNLGGLEQSGGVFHDLKGVPYRAYCFRARFYAVPAHMPNVDRNDISHVGAMLPGWRGYLERLIDSRPLFYVLFQAILRKRMPGLIRRFERRRIRSAPTVEELIESIVASAR